MSAGTITNGSTYYPDSGGYRTKPGASNANCHLHLDGTFSTATITVEFLANGDSTLGAGNDNWLPIADGSWTADVDEILNFAHPTQIRIKQASADGSTSVEYSLN